MQKRLLTRVLVTSYIIITLVVCGLAWMITVLYGQQLYNETTTKLIAELPVIAAEFREHYLVPITQASDNDNIDATYLMATCTDQYHSLWHSTAAKEQAIDNICENYQQIKGNYGPAYLEYGPQNTYFSYVLSVVIDEKDYHLIILKDAAQLIQQLNEFDRIMLLRLAAVLAIAYVLLTSAAYWGLMPLRHLKSELDNLKNGQQQTLSKNYPIELQEITGSLNELLQQNQQRQTRYQNAMNDLAHSLKTRLAASIAIIDDKSLSQEQTKQRTLQQINDMDQLVKYQLKRAMIGKQGLMMQTTPIAATVADIAQMMDKIYQAKQVQFSTNIESNLSFPLSKGDVMELVGNLLENAYRLCISEVKLSASKQQGYYQLIVEDDGPGVEDAIKEKIIQRGVRADTQTPGQGIGLAVCQELVDSYHGQLLIETSDLLGAKFIIKLPLAFN
ncbi:ATP-binding protein [Shewanella maritima]|uniref:ATP-binding protein n=1 Tax=Shewanella maritima TaxID=2520507 RepID=UPI003736FF32